VSARRLFRVSRPGRTASPRPGPGPGPGPSSSSSSRRYRRSRTRTGAGGFFRVKNAAFLTTPGARPSVAVNDARKGPNHARFDRRTRTVFITARSGISRFGAPRDNAILAVDESLRPAARPRARGREATPFGAAPGELRPLRLPPPPPPSPPPPYGRTDGGGFSNTVPVGPTRERASSPGDVGRQTARTGDDIS